MFKIGNGKDLPPIPDHLSDEGKDFIWQCLQRNPLHRPTAAKLLDHPFVKSAAPLVKPILGSEPTDLAVTNGLKALVSSAVLGSLYFFPFMVSYLSYLDNFPIIVGYLKH